MRGLAANTQFAESLLTPKITPRPRRTLSVTESLSGLEQRRDRGSHGKASSVMKLGSVFLLLALFFLLAATSWYAYLGLPSAEESMPTHGWIALILGAAFSVIVGVGLMALVFYSSRRGYDEPTHFRDGERGHQHEV